MTSNIRTKYKLTRESMIFEGRTLRRIKAIMSFGDVKKGDLGGWIESESNLSHSGDCWVYNNAKVLGDSYVLDNAQVRDNAILRGKVHVYDNAVITDNVVLSGYVMVADSAKVKDDSKLTGGIMPCNGALGYKCVLVRGQAVVEGNSQLTGNISLYNNSKVKDSILHGSVVLGDDNQLTNVEFKSL